MPGKKKSKKKDMKVSVMVAVGKKKKPKNKKGMCPSCEKAFMEGEWKGEGKEYKRARKYSNKFGKVMKEYKDKKLRSGSKKGPKVKDREQALAIAFQEARKAGRKKKRK